MTRIILKTLTICLLWMFNPAIAQVIWYESFSVPGKGIWGAGDGSIISDFSGINAWSLEYSAIELSNEGDYAKTVTTSGGRFEVCDIDGEVVWRSEPIDISGYTNVNIELIAAETGSGANTETKYLKAFYKLDDGEETLFNENGINAGNWGSAIASQKELSGKILQIICYISTHYASDKIILDEVTVWNEEQPLPPVNPFDVVINELMADPNPPEGLPDVEYIELFNRREDAVNTENWELRINGVAKKLQKNFIEPGGYLLLCATGSLQSLLPYGNVSNVVGFQGLLNKGATVEILDENGIVIDRITYSDEWYYDTQKARGGWSLERIDPHRQCNQPGNWQASKNPYGGTPGFKNSVYAENPDDIPPFVKWAIAVSEKEIEVVFSEPVDSLLLKNIQNYDVDEWEYPGEIALVSQKHILIRYNSNFQQDKIYRLQLNNLADECGNMLFDNQFKIQWNTIEPGDVLISEVLFNPFPGGEDYVEIFNPSNKLINVNRLFLANRNKNFQLTQIYLLNNEKQIFEPKSYIALTKDTNAVFPWYYIQCSTCFLQMARMPSYPNAEGYVVLLNEAMETIDEFFYTEKMHSPFLADVKGISLERISFNQKTNTPGNWHSASTDAGYGTPGYKNSQAGSDLIGKPVVIFEPEAFSPNHDGYNDEYFIRYETGDPGYVANVKIFDAAGRFVQHLVKNEILGTSGQFMWDGKDETGKRQSLGIYIVMVEIFNSRGEVHRFKDGVVLTDRWE
jgi:hypothetical protein